MSTKTATILGSTGMIGTYLKELLLADGDYSTVRILVRRPVEKTHPKLEVKLVDFDDAESFKLALDGSDIVFCAIGTTRKKVKGDNQLYARIDFEIPVKAARFCKELGCEKFVIISSVGANSKSGNFYLKLKGHVEDALKLSELESIHIMQPSVLLGDRKESRGGESVVQGGMKLIAPLLMGSWKKYKPIQGKTVAQAMINAGKKEDKGFFKYEYEEILKIAGGIK